MVRASKPNAQDGFDDMMARLTLSRRDLVKRATVAGLSISVGSALLAACGEDGDDEDDDAAAVADEPTPEGDDAGDDGDEEVDEEADETAEDTSDEPTSEADPDAAVVGPFDRPDRDQLPSPQRLVFASGRDPDNLDLNVTSAGWTVRAVGLVYETLVREAAPLEFVPGLAESWEISDDASEYTFSLREDVQFHDGTHFDAEAVKFAFDRIADPATQSQRAAGLIGPYESSEVIDEYTVRIALEAPYAAFLEGIGQEFCGIPSPTAVQELGDDFALQPVGTGPMKFKEWLQGERITLEKFTEYRWAPPFFNLEGGGPAYLDEYDILIVLEDGVRVGMLESGEADLIDYIPPEDVERLNAIDGIDVEVGLPPGISQLFSMNTQRPPLDDINVRQALLHAVDQEFYNQNAAFGLSKPLYVPLASATFAHNSEIDETFYPYDPERAAELLDEAGWQVGSDGVRQKDGETLELEFLIVSESPQTRELLFQDAMRELGVTVTFITGTTAWRAETVSAGEYHLSWGGLSGTDPHGPLSAFYHSSNIGTPHNMSRFENQRVDELLDEGVQTVDNDARKEIYFEVQRILVENAVFISTYENLWITGRASKVHNYAYNAHVYYPWMHSVYIAE